MKKTAFITILLVFVLSLMAQTAKEEAIQSLDNAKRLITQDNYAKAQEEISFASSKINEILSEQLVKYLPDAPAGYKVDERNAQGLGQMGGFLGSANAITAIGRYSGTTEDADGNIANLTLTISIGGLIGKTAGFAALGQMFGGGGAGTGSKSIRVSGYTANQEFQSGDSSGKLTVQVGEKVSVLIEGNGIKTADIMKTLVEKIDLAKLEKAF